MRILVFGAGVIGTIYGYLLAQAGNDVIHYVRPGKKARLDQGIRLRLLDGRAKPPKTETACYKLKTVETLSPNDRYELFIVSV
ncbi:MAG: hypothetical protein M1546_08945 [Chloroflexi bacterium]|nr:hypothetical protein [Chloroflexota bacterium]